MYDVNDVFISFIIGIIITNIVWILTSIYINEYERCAVKHNVYQCAYNYDTQSYEPIDPPILDD